MASALLGRLAGLGLLVRDGSTYQNAEATARYLVSSSSDYLGDRLRQVLAEAGSYAPLVQLRPEGKK